MHDYYVVAKVFRVVTRWLFTGSSQQDPPSSLYIFQSLYTVWLRCLFQSKSMGFLLLLFNTKHLHLEMQFLHKTSQFELVPF